MMHGPILIRFTNAKQAKFIHEYKNVKGDYTKPQQLYGTIKHARQND